MLIFLFVMYFALNVVIAVEWLSQELRRGPLAGVIIAILFGVFLLAFGTPTVMFYSMFGDM